MKDEKLSKKSKKKKEKTINNDEETNVFININNIKKILFIYFKISKIY